MDKKNGSSRRPQRPKTTRFKESSTKVAKLHTQPTTATFSTPQDRSTFNLSTQGTTFENTANKSFPQNVSTGKLNLLFIVIVLLIVFIVAIAIVFGILFFRRHQSHKNQDRLQDRVTCTYEVPPSSELQSIDPEHVQQIQSSAALTVHLTLSQTESGLATYEEVSDCSKECEYDDIDESYRKKRPAGEECSDIKERARENTGLVSGEKGIQHSPLYDKKEEERHHVYAVVHKERKERGNSEASTLIKSSCRPQEGTSSVSVESETPQAGGSIEYLYAAVEKTKKKKKQPQPPPYRGHVYANLVHSRESGAKLVKEQSQTVYAQFDHAQTARVMISQQNLEEKKKGKHY